ncbi:MAG TPA: hypothetical protein VFS60_10955 [Thermoanaerobaculia bacterium]|nr:hypothetical protein [Thermoanaerobaculia bacterium]
MSQTLSCRLPVAAVFSPTDREKSRDSLRFILASRCLGATHRAAGTLDASTNPRDREARIYLFLLTVGAAKEAADAFRCVDRHGWFDTMLAGLPETARGRLPEILAGLRSDCDKSEPSSAYQHLKALRSGTGYHWSSGHVESALKQFWSDGAEFTFVIADPADAPPWDEFLQAALSRVVEMASNVSQLNLEAALDDIATLAGRLGPLADAAYLALVARAGLAAARSMVGAQPQSPT